ncbi:MAG: erythromycin esterase family protein [Hyphomonas sp.]|nr:erythromycin esterase family protein [Hyphomonas sp.]
MTHRPAPLSRRNFLMASASAALVSACATQTGSGGLPDTSLAPTMTSLLAAQAMPIRRLAPDDPGVKALAKRLAGGKLAGLGEATHGSHEDALLKSVLIQSMVENHELRLILLEANRTGCAQLDAYASAAPTGRLAAEAVKEAPVFRILKTEVIADLLEWLRGWNAVNGDRRVRVVGIDCQASSQDAADALAALAALDSGAAEAIGVALAPILTADARAARHDRMLKQITSAQRFEAEAACRMLEAELNSAGLAHAAFAARLAWQGLNAFEHETSDGDLSRATPEYWSRRDVFMAENAVALALDEAAVFWGHNAHVAGGKPSGDSAGYEPSGAVLRRKLGRNYTVLIQEFAEAAFLAIPTEDGLPPDTPLVQIQRTARPDTLNALLAEASAQTAWFDLANLPESSVTQAWRRTPIGLDWYGYAANEAPHETDILKVPPDSLFDLLVIHPKLTPARML